MNIEKVRDDPRLPKHLRGNHTPGLVALFFTVDKFLAKTRCKEDEYPEKIKLEIPPGYRVV